MDSAARTHLRWIEVSAQHQNALKILDHAHAPLPLLFRQSGRHAARSVSLRRPLVAVVQKRSDCTCNEIPHQKGGPHCSVTIGESVQKSCCCMQMSTIAHHNTMSKRFNLRCTVCTNRFLPPFISVRTPLGGNWSAHSRSGTVTPAHQQAHQELKNEWKSFRIRDCPIPAFDHKACA